MKGVGEKEGKARATEEKTRGQEKGRRVAILERKRGVGERRKNIALNFLIRPSVASGGEKEQGPGASAIKKGEGRWEKTGINLLK